MGLSRTYLPNRRGETSTIAAGPNRRTFAPAWVVVAVTPQSRGRRRRRGVTGRAGRALARAWRRGARPRGYARATRQRGRTRPPASPPAPPPASAGYARRCAAPLGTR